MGFRRHRGNRHSYRSFLARSDREGRRSSELPSTVGTVVAVGADGPGLFSDDTACDVRDEYREALEDGAGDSEAESAVLRRFADALTDPDEWMVVWLALAVTQSRLGRLSETVREQALTILDAGGDLVRWHEAGAGAVRRRAAVLDKVRAQLEGPQPSPRGIRRRRRPRSSLSGIGQVLAHQTGRGRVHLMRVTALVDLRCDVQPVIRLLDYVGTAAPDPSLLPQVPDRRRRPPWKKVDFRVIDDDATQRERVGLHVVGSMPATPPDLQAPKAAVTWAELCAYLETRDQLKVS